MAITGDPFSGYVLDQIDIRQKNLAYNPNTKQSYDELVLLNNNKSAWVRLASSVNLIEGAESIESKYSLPQQSGNFLAKNFVLFGGIYNVNSPNPRLGGIVPNLDERNNFLKASQYSYGLGSSEYGYSPIPGLTSVKIEHANRGALRNCNITLEASNKDQLEILETLYLRLGYYMLCEWGHVNYVDKEGNFVSSPNFFTPAFNTFFEEGKVDSDVENSITAERVRTGGNYDGALIKIVNYNWKLNEDGSYSVNLKGISKGGIIDSLILNYPEVSTSKAFAFRDYKVLNVDDDKKLSIIKSLSQPYDKKNDKIEEVYKKAIANALALPSGFDILSYLGAIGFVSNDEPPSDTSVLDIKSSFSEDSKNNLITILDQNKSLFNKQLFLLTLALKEANWIASPTDSKKNLYKILPPSSTFSRTQFLLEQNLSTLPELISIKFNNPENEKNSYEYNYITLGYLLEIIKRLILPQPNNEASSIKVSNDYNDNYMFTHFFQHSTNPGVCLIPFRDGGNVNYLSDILSNSFRIPDVPYGGRLMAIHVNVECIAKTVQDSIGDDNRVNLYTFLDKLIFQIQNALGNINNFVITFDETNGLQIKDDTVIPNLETNNNNDKDVNFRLSGVRPGIEGSFVKSVSTQSEITNKLVTQLSIGSTAKNPENPSTSLLARWNEGLLDRLQYNTNKNSSNNATSTDTSSPPITATSLGDPLSTLPEEPKSLAEKVFEQKIKDSPFKQDLKKKYNDYISQFIIPTYTQFKYPGEAAIKAASDNLTVFLEYDLGVKTINGSIPGKGFIPINLSLEFDGLSGILPYQRLKVSSEVLPKSYEDKIDFIVQGIDNTIQNNEWITSLTTLSIPKKINKASNASNKDASEFSISSQTI